jgi:hypothetical protein
MLKESGTSRLDVSRLMHLGWHFRPFLDYLLKAEGTGLEPATGFPAPHFQCGR